MKSIISISAFFATTMIFAAGSDMHQPGTVLALGDVSQTTTIIEQHTQNKIGEVDTTTIQTQTVAPSMSEMPAWEQALQPDTTTATTTKDIEIDGSQSEISTVQKKVVAPSTNEMPVWEQALQPQATETITTREKDIVTQDGDEITIIQSEEIAPVPAWEQALQPQATEIITTREKDIIIQDGDEITIIQSEEIVPVPAWDQPQPEIIIETLK